MARRELSAADIYHKFAAQLDKDGFRLYHAAQRSTGFQPYDAFPYEDNRGAFEAADGHTLLRFWKQRISMPSHGRSSPAPPMNGLSSAKWTPLHRNTARFVKQSARMRWGAWGWGIS